MHPRRLLLFGVAAAALAAAQVGAAAGPALAATGSPSLHEYKQHHKSTGSTTATPTAKTATGADDTMTQASGNAIERTAPGTAIPAGAFAAAAAQAAKLGSVGRSWTELTNQPADIEPAGYNDPFWSNLGAGFSNFVGGRMTALAVDGPTLYAGAADGGVWKSTNQGGTWTPIFDQMPTLSIGSLAINPADHSLWVGTGESNTSFDAYAGQGVYRSGDGGASFARVGGSELVGATSYRLVFDGLGKVYDATSQGLYARAAADTASPWTLALKPDPNETNSPYRTSHITDVVVRPGTNGLDVLAVLGWRGGTRAVDTSYNGFYLSTAGGLPGTFTRLTPTGDIDPSDIGRTSFAYAADGSKLYAVVESPARIAVGAGSVLQGVFVSNSGDPAGPWTLIADNNKLCASGTGLVCGVGYDPGVQAWYNQEVVVDPSNANHVIFGLEEVYQSFDGGQTISTISPYWNYVFPCEQNNTCPLTTHPDQHAVAIAGNTLLIGNDGGVYSRPLEDTNARGDWTDLNATLHALQYYDAMAGRVPGGLAAWGGLQDNGFMVLNPKAPTNINPASGDGFYTIVNPANGSDAVGEYTYMNPYITTNGGHSFRTVSPSCFTVDPAGPMAGCDPNPRFNTPMTTDVNNPNHWVTGGQYVWTDTAAWNTVCNAASRCDWTNVHDVGAGHTITAIAVNGNTIYVGWCGGGCNPGGRTPFSSGIDTNAGGAWHTLTASNLPNRFVAGMTVDPRNASHVFAIYSGFSRRWIPSAGVGHVFESMDGGSSFTDISGNLPDVPSDALVLLNGKLALGTDLGAYFAVDGQGASTVWSRLGTGLPNVAINNMRLNPDGNTILAATHGRGLWQIHMP